MKKTLQEIENIRKACAVSDLGFKFILKEIKLGITEKELARRLTGFLKSNSHGIAFRTIVAFGENSSIIHHKPTNRKLKDNDNILFDFGARTNGYCSDISRTVFFRKVSTKQKRIYKTVLTAQKKTIEYLKLSVSRRKLVRGFKVDAIARNYLKEKGHALPHSLGHGVGKRVHSGLRISPKSKRIIKKNMIFTIEPAIYLKDFGIRIEDTILVTNKSIETLTNSSKEIIII